MVTGMPNAAPTASAQVPGTQTGTSGPNGEIGATGSPVSSVSASFDLRIVLDRDERQALGRKIGEKLLEALSSVQERHERILSWTNQFEATVQAKDWPWPNCAQLNVPVTRSVSETIVAKLHKAMSGVNPLFRADMYPGTDEEAAVKIEQLIEWQLETQVEIAHKWDEALRGAVSKGNSILFVEWVKEYGRVRGLGLEPQADGSYMRTLEETTALVRNQPNVEVIDVLDFCLYPANALTVKQAIGVGHRKWLTRNDLAKGIQSGKFDKDYVLDVLDHADDPDTQAERVGGDDTRRYNTGVSDADPTDRNDRSFEVFDLVWSLDMDNDGIDEDVHLVIEVSSSTIIQIERFPYWHGQRNYFNWCPFPREKSFWGYSIPEIIESLQTEINAIRNQRVDAGTLTLSPMMALNRQVQWDVNKNRYRPGGVIRMDDPGKDIRQISFTAATQNAFAEESAAKEWVEKVTGVSDYAQGASPSRSRTLGEISGIMGASTEKFDLVISRLNRVNGFVAQQVLMLDQQFLDDKTEFLITQDNERVFQSVTMQELKMRVLLVAQGNSLTTNREMDIQASETLFQMAANNPLINKFLTRVWHVTNKYLQSVGIERTEDYIGTLAEAQVLEKQSQSQKPQAPPPALAGRLGEVESLAVLIQTDPTIVASLQQAASLVLQYTAEEGKVQNALGVHQQVSGSIGQHETTRRGIGAGAGQPPVTGRIPGQLDPQTREAIASGQAPGQGDGSAQGQGAAQPPASPAPTVL